MYWGSMDVANMPKVVPMEEREWFVLFSICVAGKSAKQTQHKINELLAGYRYMNESEFEIIRGMILDDNLEVGLKWIRMGQYKRIEKAFREVVKLDVKTDLTVEKLETIPGIGPKTARFIVLYTDPDAECVPLDTHILKYLAKNYPAFSVPKSTPPKGRKYKELEELFQYDAKRQGKSVRQLDTEVWQSYART
jgi:3-methyladenine DNA glycosylase/8-oxoguanine DNA glycosylase